MTQTHAVRQRAWSTQGKLELCDGGGGGVQHGAKLSDLGDTGSPREAKWPSVMLRSRLAQLPPSLPPANLFCIGQIVQVHISSGL